MKIAGIWILTTVMIFQCSGQGLDIVPPVLISKLYHPIDTSVSFILTPANVLEIIDAGQPWPPRWFATNNYDKTAGWDSARVFYEGARVQNGFVTFYKDWSAKKPHAVVTRQEGFIVCNQKMEVVDTVRGVDVPIDHHDFRLNQNGEKLILAKMDTVLNISSLSGRPRDTAQLALVDVIEILDRDDHLVFRWNAALGLGVDAEYFNYGGLQSRSSKPAYVDWSHANSVDWDFDGNIIYSFRSIGVGKISRGDGHIIWRFDRNKMPYISDHDTIAFYLQHGFDKVSNGALHTTYSLFSSGDQQHRLSYGLQFSVNKQSGRIHLVSKKKPAVPVMSHSGGNYEIAANGDYILCYGEDINETNKTKIFFEYGNSGNELYAMYNSVNKVSTYDVHQMKDFKPPRPAIIKKGNKLLAKGNMKEWIWYQLSGPDNATVKQVGQGPDFKPRSPGVFCVTGKYGIGWSVSLPFVYAP